MLYFCWCLCCWNFFFLACEIAHVTSVVDSFYSQITLAGALKMCGCTDKAGKPVLLCSYNDNIVRLYDLPTFTERGQLFSREEVRALQVGLNNLVFSGDSRGDVKVWSWIDTHPEAVVN